MSEVLPSPTSILMLIGLPFVVVTVAVAVFESFVVVVVSILVSSLVFSFVNWRNMWVRMGLHLLLLIPIVGVTYEFNRYVGGHDNKVTRFLARPGLWLQNFTTNEPDDSMLEVAIEALELVIPEEKGKDAW